MNFRTKPNGQCAFGIDINYHEKPFSSWELIEVNGMKYAGKNAN